MPDSLKLLTWIVREAPPRLRALPADLVGRKPAPGKWSPKEELGHLIDSAANNHQRMVRARLEDRPALPGYDGNAWVMLHGYQSRDWDELIDIWQAVNLQLIAAVRGGGPEGRARECTVGEETAGGSGPTTLGAVLDDYLRHLLHHLVRVGVEVAVREIEEAP